MNLREVNNARDNTVGFIHTYSYQLNRQLLEKRRRIMSSTADFILDFLEIVGNNEKYNKHQWDWDNLPDFETMMQIKRENRK